MIDQLSPLIIKFYKILFHVSNLVSGKGYIGHMCALILGKIRIVCNKYANKTCGAPREQ